ncbi:hypothetical protein SAMN05428642_1011242 [Flaviramulus basaltis]|uniref:Uncharacterized protein n=1 Tax=Flaviramulus basaltis TaxID=369401 RepID=A0A1K2IER2_9FLAO|nr:EboA domain-containing protein [Flaviramulus basaltis]SFZ90917.1 hypothetical protein SAMN05428642_1011242 [Flaviramulus basaltis]
MVSKVKQEQFTELVKSKLTSTELEWVNEKMAIVSDLETASKFNVFFSLVSRFISNEIVPWKVNEKEILENIYPGFSKTEWTKQDLTRSLLMTALDVSVNKSILNSFFQIAEMKEQVALYKGLYFLENATEFQDQFAEGIRTNMANVFDAIASGNPFAQNYLEEEEWNQLILKSFFMGRKIYNIQNIDQGKNKHLANMLQDYVKERWAAGRQVSLEIWRMIDGYLREDIKKIFSEKHFEGTEKEVITELLEHNKPISQEYWNTIGKTN